MFKKVRRISKELAIETYNACFNRSYGSVMMLHRIGPKEFDRLPCIAELNVTPEWLQMFVDEHRLTYDFISLDGIWERMNNPQKRTRPFIAFTFDDGFRDNLEYGLPFFEHNQIPFSVFVTVEYINRHPAFNYPFLLERIIRGNRELHFGNETIDCSSIDKKNKAFVMLKNRVLSFPYKSFEDTFNAFFSDYLSDSLYEDLMLSWDDVKELSDSQLCTIGSHTMTHCRLSQLSSSELRWELEESKRQIENRIGQEVNYISYPFGWFSDINDTVIAEASLFYRAGFQSHGGGVRRQDNSLMKINRIMLTEDD